MQESSRRPHWPSADGVAKVTANRPHEMRRPLLIASVLLACAHALWLAHAHAIAERGGGLGMLLWVAVPLIAFLTAVFSRQRQFLTGMLVAVPAAALFVISNAAYELLGHAVEFSGALGALFVFAMSLPVCGLLAAVGAGLARLSLFHPV